MIVSEVKEREKMKTPLTYPYLGIYTFGSVFFIVLFHKESSGMIVTTNDHNSYTIGHYNDKWNEQTFEVFEDDVILSNIKE